MRDNGIVWRTLRGYVWDACGAGVVHVCAAVSGVRSPVRLVAAWATVRSVQPEASRRCRAHLVLCACTVRRRQGAAIWLVVGDELMALRWGEGLARRGALQKSLLLRERSRDYLALPIRNHGTRRKRHLAVLNGASRRRDTD